MTSRLDKQINETNERGSRLKLEPCHKWAQGPIKKMKQVTRTKWDVYMYVVLI